MNSAISLVKVIPLLTNVTFTPQTSRLPEVMGYTDAPVRAEATMPPALEAWMQDVSEAARWAEQYPDADLTRYAAPIDTTMIEPMLDGIEWDQNTPYNNLIPGGCITGCAATAVAQVMYYYGYPEHGFGSHSYELKGTVFSADFENTYYQWDQMFGHYNANTCTDAQCHAVAELSYHVGVALDMNYDLYGSGSFGQLIPRAISQYFGYNSNVLLQERSVYTYDEWNQLLLAELKAGRPVVFNGQSDIGGHCFVVDGHNSEGLYHVNWGWSGDYNGWYDICILRPEGAGSGAIPSQLGFSYLQSAVLYFTPEEGVGNWLPSYFAEWFTLNDDAIIIENFSNDHTSPLQGTLGLQVTDTLGNVIASRAYDAVQLDGFVDRFPAVNDTIAIDDDLRSFISAQGLDKGRIIPCFYHGDDLEHPVSVPCFLKGPRYIDFDLSADTLQLSQEVAPTNLETILLTDTIRVSSGADFDINIQLVNHSAKQFNGTFELDIVTANTQNGTLRQHYTNNRSYHVEQGDTISLTFTANIKKLGAFKANLTTRNNSEDGEFSYLLLGKVAHIETYKSEVSPAELVMTQPITLLDDHAYAPGSAIAAQVELSNTGGNFADQLVLSISKSKSQKADHLQTIESYAQIPMDAEAENVVIEGTIGNLEPGTYYARLNSRDELGEITSVKVASGVTPYVAVQVTESDGIESVSVDSNRNVRWFDLMGRPATEPRQGIFFKRND